MFKTSDGHLARVALCPPAWVPEAGIHRSPAEGGPGAREAGGRRWTTVQDSHENVTIIFGRLVPSGTSWTPPRAPRLTSLCSATARSLAAWTPTASPVASPPSLSPTPPSPRVPRGAYPGGCESQSSEVDARALRRPRPRRMATQPHRQRRRISARTPRTSTLRKRARNTSPRKNRPGRVRARALAPG